ncbi:MAG: hypothetical protein ABFS09_09425, partial [Thermodesulfobacteriota bacterium]
KLFEAHALFVRRGINDWAALTEQASNKLINNDFSFLEELWLKFAPTCDIDDLLIIMPQSHNPPLTEEEANELNEELAVIANETFSAIERVKEMTLTIRSG